MDTSGHGERPLPYVPFTTFDRIWLAKKSIKATMAEKGITDPANVTAKMLAEPFVKLGLKPPSLPQILTEKRLALGFSDEAFSALKTVSGSGDPIVDVPSLSKNLLDNHNVTTDLKKHPLEQSILVHILARFKKSNKKLLRKADLPSLKDRAMEAGDLHRRVESVIPREAQTPEFQTCLEGLLYGSQVKWDLYGSLHMKEQEEEIEAVRESRGFIWQHQRIPVDHAKTIRSKLPSRLERVARNSADLRRYVDAWDQRMAEVDAYIARQDDSSSSSDSSDSDADDADDASNVVPGKKRTKGKGKAVPRGRLERPAGSSDRGESSDDVEGKGKSTSKGKGKGKSKSKDKAVSGQGRELPAAAGHGHSKCGVHRPVSSKSAGKQAKKDSIEPSSDEPSPKKQKKRSKNGKTIDRMTQDQAMEISMSRSFMLYPEGLFVGESKAYSGGTPLKVKIPPKLAIVDLTRETHLLENTESSNRALKVVLESIVDALHPQGTMALALPRAWLSSGMLFAGALAGIDNAVVEDHPLMITYEAASGDPIVKGQESHLLSQSELVVLVHRPCPPEKPFTCNRHVVPTDVFGGSSTGAFPEAKQILALKSSPGGRSNGGSSSFFSEKAAQLLIGRFTNATDTVLGIGVEATTVAEQAIGQGRCVELFVPDEARRAAIGRGIADAFRTAQGRGMFREQSELVDEARIGPENKPHGMPYSIAPLRVTKLLQETHVYSFSDELRACFGTAQQIAADSNYELKGKKDRSNSYLLPKKPLDGKVPELKDIPVWGNLIVYRSPDDAQRALTTDDVDERYVRLIRVAGNAQLRLMLDESGGEWCGVDAALYVQVDPRCPVYWMRWSDRESEADLDIVCDVPRRGDWWTVLCGLTPNDNGEGGVRVRHARNKPSETFAPGSSRGVALLISSSCGRIVGSGNFPRRSVSSGL